MVGVDEVGRGCLAGPLLVVAARAKTELPSGLRDSKLLSRKQRLEVLERLSNCCDFAEGWVKAVEIDNYGLSKALRLGVKRALNGLRTDTAEEIIMDGKVSYIPKKFIKARTLIDADNLIPVVSAASVYAKVTRDNYMFELAKKHPNYKFQNHVGYGTAEHLKALSSFGVIKFVHRSSFMPVSKMMSGIR
ncbi:MAG TPA: ribonuclease HII [Candidatus Saccharimonadales bacterium]|nr:ribonuclease HII [Candidatus Saccharimonadales bacterium]